MATPFDGIIGELLNVCIGVGDDLVLTVNLDDKENPVIIGVAQHLTEMQRTRLAVALCQVLETEEEDGCPSFHHEFHTGVEGEDGQPMGKYIITIVSDDMCDVEFAIKKVRETSEDPCNQASL